MIKEMQMKHLINILHEGSYSCVIRNGKVQTFAQRSVADLYRLLTNKPEFLTSNVWQLSISILHI
jgi:iron complex outermembrane receptor protein